MAASCAALRVSRSCRTAFSGASSTSWAMSASPSWEAFSDRRRRARPGYGMAAQEGARAREAAALAPVTASRQLMSSGATAVLSRRPTISIRSCTSRAVRSAPARFRFARACSSSRRIATATCWGWPPARLAIRTPRVLTAAAQDSDSRARPATSESNLRRSLVSRCSNRRLDVCAFWVGADDDGVGDGDYLVERQVRPKGVLTYRLWAAGLVDA
jgi:hypothetical protein